MRVPRSPFLEKYRSGKTDHSDRFNPVTHLPASQPWTYAGWALVPVIAMALLALVGRAAGWP
jgi:hypothetical protein